MPSKGQWLNNKYSASGVKRTQKERKVTFFCKENKLCDAKILQQIQNICSTTSNLMQVRTRNKAKNYLYSQTLPIFGHNALVKKALKQRIA